MQKAIIPEGAIHRLDENKTVQATAKEDASLKIQQDMAVFLAKEGNSVEVLPDNMTNRTNKNCYTNSILAKRRAAAKGRAVVQGLTEVWKI